MAAEEEEKIWGAQLENSGYIIEHIDLQSNGMMGAIYTLLGVTEDYPKQTQVCGFIQKQKDVPQQQNGKTSLVRFVCC